MLNRYTPGLLSLLLVAATLLPCGCTTTTTVKPNQSALQQDASFEDTSLGKMSIDELLTKGYALLAEEKLSMARIHFMAALRRDPESIGAFLGLGELGYRSGDYPAALVNYQRAGALDPQNLAAVLGQVRTLRQQGNFAPLGELMSRAMTIAPNDPHVLTELAITYNLQGQSTLATPLFAEVAEHSADQAAAFNNIGVNQISRREYREAVVSLQQARQLNPTDQQIGNNLAMALALAGEEQQALALYGKTVGEAAAWNNLGYLYMTQGRHDDAERALRRAIDVNPRYYRKAKENLDRLEQLRSTPPR
jgi:Flp pilus assembly protein TadD